MLNKLVIITFRHKQTRRPPITIEKQSNVLREGAWIGRCHSQRNNIRERAWSERQGCRNGYGRILICVSSMNYFNIKRLSKALGLSLSNILTSEIDLFQLENKNCNV